MPKSVVRSSETEPLVLTAEEFLRIYVSTDEKSLPVIIMVRCKRCRIFSMVGLDCCGRTLVKPPEYAGRKRRPKK